MDFSINELVACARREVAQRKKVYPRLIAKGSIEAKWAKEQIAMMEAIRENLESQQQPRLF